MERKTIPKRYQVLLVDDQPVELRSNRLFLEAFGFRVDTADSGERALELVRKQPDVFAVALVDFRMPHMDGAQTTTELLKLDRKLKVLIYSADDRRNSMRSAWHSGAVDFLDKYTDPQQIHSTVQKWMNIYRESYATLSLENLQSEHSQKIRSINMIGNSKALASVADQVWKYRTKKVPVFIVGERGTGKELVGKALHNGSERHFFAVNCAAFNGNPDLMMKVLFGNKKGAYTGAHRDELGLLRQAQQGTVFLDEIHHLEPSHQSILLRALQEGRVQPLGDTQTYPYHCRILAAAQPVIHEKLQCKTFLQDLYDRICVGYIEIPPLAQRKEDIAPLIAYFTEQCNSKNREDKRLLQKTVDILMHYPWPGNARELENEIKRLCIEVEEPTIKPKHLPPKFTPHTRLPTHISSSGRPRKETIEYLLYHRRLSERAVARKVGMPYTSFQRLLRKLCILSPRSRSRKPHELPSTNPNLQESAIPRAF